MLRGFWPRSPFPTLEALEIKAREPSPVSSTTTVTSSVKRRIAVLRVASITLLFRDSISQRGNLSMARWSASSSFEVGIGYLRIARAEFRLGRSMFVIGVHSRRRWVGLLTIRA